MTITEALAEIKLIDSKLDKKRITIRTYLTRQEQLKDPLLKEGGSAEYIRRERQAICDLEDRKVSLRRAIADANTRTMVTIDGDARTVADWLVWRRDVAPTRESFLTQMRTTLDHARRDATQRGFAVVSGAESITKPGDIVVNIDEAELVRETEHLDTILGTLDGQLSLKNATVAI